jgi:hypothetical protein
MTFVLLLPNQHLLAWQTSPGAPAEVLPRIRSRAWRLPPQLAARLVVPQGMNFRALAAGKVVVVYPEYPLQDLAPLRSLPIPEVQRRMLALLGLGLTQEQVGLRMGRSARWVRYQLVRLRRRCGYPSRPRRVRRIPA